MIRCVVIDDEKPARERLKRLLAAHQDFEVVGEAADARHAVTLLDELRPDLCFLDVRMPEGDGFEVIRQAKKVPRVIFVTAFDEYAVQAFEVHSLDYLLKPVGKRRFAEALERVRASIGETADQQAGPLLELLNQVREDLREDRGAPAERKLPARRGNRIVLLEVEEVLFFEAEETLVFARTPEGRFLVERTLAALEQQLTQRFFRTHRRYLVNLSRINEILPGEAGTYTVIVGEPPGEAIPLSRRQARRLRELIPW